jgi:hypothetical protein
MITMIIVMVGNLNHHPEKLHLSLTPLEQMHKFNTKTYTQDENLALWGKT